MSKARCFDMETAVAAVENRPRTAGSIGGSARC